MRTPLALEVTMPRAILTVVAVCVLSVVAGCVMHETYGDHALPESELAVVKGYWHYRLLYDEELHIVSVDGKRTGGKSGWPYAYSISLPPGRHWLQIAILRNSSDITRCAFDGTFEAQHCYKLQRLNHNQFLLAHPSSPRFAATIAMDITAPTKEVRHTSVPAVCGKGSFCRDDSDCPALYFCLDTGFEFGTCIALPIAQ